MERLQRQREELLERYQPRRRPGGRPARARRDRGRGARRGRATAWTGPPRHRRPIRRTAGTTRPPTLTSGGCCATMPPAGSTSSTRCRPTRRPDPRADRSTTSWSPMPASGSTTWWSGCGARSSTSTWPGCRTRSPASRPEDLAANREMVRDLNGLLQERLAGRDPDASEFLAKHGRFFPGARDLDDIIEQLAQRMAAMQSLLRSMTPGAARGAAGDDGRAAARRPAALGPRPAGRDAGPAAARRPGRAVPLRGRRAAGPRRRAGADRAAPRARSPRGRPDRRRRARATSSRSIATEVRELLGEDCGPRPRRARRPGPAPRGGGLPERQASAWS